MKKIFYSMLMMAMAAMTFTSCEDVPMPYGWPFADGGGNETVVVEPAGSGTQADPYNVAAAQAFIKTLDADVQSDEVYVKGFISQIDEVDTGQYGNATYYISDTKGSTAGQLEIYRGYSLGGNKFTKSDEIKEGDEVIVKGKVVMFRGSTPEFAQGSSIYSLNGKGGSSSEPQPGGEAKGTGTISDPFNAAGANKYVAAMAADVESEKDIYIKGKIIAITDNNQFNTQYGNATFYISDSGNDTDDKFYVFRTLYLGNKKYESGTLPKPGDEVVICGKVVNYRGNTPETVANKSYIYSLNGQTEPGSVTPQPQPGGDAKGTGTLEDPFNPLAAINYASALASGAKSDKDVYIKGIISNIKEEFGTQFGNATFSISEDGTDNNEFLVFRTLYLGNVKYTGGTNIKKGDEVIICGKVTNYMGNTPETSQNESYVYSLNGKTSGGDEPGPGPEPGGETGEVTKTVSGTTVTLTVVGAAEGGNVAVNLNEQGWADKAAPAAITLSDGTKIEFAQGEGSNAPVYYAVSKGVRVYAKNIITISGNAVAKVVMTCDSYNGTDYVGNSTLTATSKGNTFTIVNDHSDVKGGTQLRVQTITITYAK